MSKKKTVTTSKPPTPIIFLSYTGPRTLPDQETEKVVVEVASIPKGDVSRILGRGGDTLQEIMRKCDVVAWVLESLSADDVVND
ncbi:hypothetical protein HDU76_005605, partial [Blyttiomyces sp. JEL0837]